MSGEETGVREGGRGLLVPARILLVGALGVSIYLTTISLSGDAVAGCAEGSGCDTVLTSKWSKALGVPVAPLGALSYLFLLVCSVREQSRVLGAIVAVMVISAAIWFALVQAVILKSFCQWCCLTHGLAALGSVLLLLSWSRRGVTAGPAWTPLLGVLAVVAMAGIQFASDEPVGARDVAAGEVVVERKDGDPGTLLVHGEFEFVIADLPALGDPASADQVIVGIFDYTCDHCVKLYAVMEELVADSGGKLAVVMLPGFFEENARAVQELMLSLYRDDPGLYADVAPAVHERALAPKIDEVTMFVGQMLPGDGVDGMRSRQAAGVQDTLAVTAAVLQRNQAIVKMRKLPQLMLGDTVVVGVSTQKDYYLKLFDEVLSQRESGN